MIILFSVTRASAFTLISQNPNQKGWASKTVTYRLNPTNCPSNIGDILNAATGLWNSVATSSLTVKVDGTSFTTPAQLKSQSAPDAPVIVCDPSFGTTTGQDPNGSPAVGFIGSQTQPINYGGIILNVQAGAQDNINNIGTTLSQITIAHEMGHSLGLGHSADANALMYWNASARTHLALAQDDMDGITYLYPRNEIGGDGILGCGLTKDARNSPSPRSDLPILIFLFPLALLFILRARGWERVLEWEKAQE